MYSFVLPFHMILDVPVMQPCWSSSTVQSLSISFIYDSINLVNVPSELITTGTMVHFFSFHGPTTSYSNFSVNNSFLTFPFPQSWFQTGKKSIKMTMTSWLSGLSVLWLFLVSVATWVSICNQETRGGNRDHKSNVKWTRITFWWGAKQGKMFVQSLGWHTNLKWQNLEGNGIIQLWVLSSDHRKRIF